MHVFFPAFKYSIHLVFTNLHKDNKALVPACDLNEKQSSFQEK